MTNKMTTQPVQRSSALVTKSRGGDEAVDQNGSDEGGEGGAEMVYITKMKECSPKCIINEIGMIE